MLGLDGVYTQITQENMPLIRGMSSSYGLSYVPGTWIESIQIIKGSGSVVNGFESLTGQINLEYYKPNSAPKLFWNAYINQEGKLENNLLLAKQNGDWQSNLFTHVSYFDKEIDKRGELGGERIGDKFLDVPKTKQVNIFNRWKYKGNPNYGMQFMAKALIEERLGGQILLFQKKIDILLILIILYMRYSLKLELFNRTHLVKVQDCKLPLDYIIRLLFLERIIMKLCKKVLI